MLTLEQIKTAREKIAPYIRKTPLLRLPALDSYLGCQVYVKAECMQTTGAFKLRGAMNKVLSLTQEELERGIVTASSGNHGRAVAYAARMFGTKATIVMPETAPTMKKEGIKALGGEVRECPAAVRFEVAAQICEEKGAVMVPPYNDEQVMGGQGTLGLEMLEQCPEIDTFVVPASGGGLIGGIATAVKGMAPEKKVIGAEPAVLPRYTVSLKAGQPTAVEQTTTIADALVSQKPGDICFPAVAANVDGFADVDEEYILKGWKLLITEGKIFAEPAACIGMGAALQGLLDVKPEDKVCFVLSGGNAALEQLRQLEDVTI